MSQAFYRKYRSKELGEIVGQDHITSVLTAALKKGKIAHAYLFTGPRGVGKTSVARILAHEINKIPYTDESYHPDIIEIDAASNNGIDDIRQLRDQVQVAPFSADKRIYIIDEVHMLSKSAFNALLKTLEEPPAHVVFIMATTDAQKLPATIVSRTQQFVFRYISEKEVTNHLRKIADTENIKITDEALSIIAERGGGSFRDSISLLDQISSMQTEGEISVEDLEKTLGLTPLKNIENLIGFYESQNTEAIVDLINDIKKSGTNLQIFIDQFVNEIKHSLNTKPNLVSLLGPLIEARSSNFIDIELLCVLIQPPKYKLMPSTVAAQKTVITELIPPTKPVVEKSAKKTSDKPKASAKKTKEHKPAKDTSPNSPSGTTDLGEAKPFNWDDFLSELKEQNMPTYAIINGADRDVADGKIKIYTGRAMHKKKLESPRYHALLGEILQKIGAGGWVFEISDQHRPPEDESTATILDIMGGGEEVKIDG